MRYGLPYQGSKNAIAEKLVSVLPCADNFYDLFAGGCAITHRAMIDGRWKNYYANDIDNIPTLFFDAVNGKYKDEKRWISREDFARLKDADLYVSLCWSFGNNRKAYLYSKEIEPWKKALHYARVLGDNSLLRDFGIKSDGNPKDIKKHHNEYKDKYIKWYIKNVQDNKFCGEKINTDLSRLEHLERLKNLQQLQRLQSLQRSQLLQISQKSYDEVEIKPNSVIYCDIPYENTTGYKSGDFDFKKFYDWASNQTELVFISSYHISDDRFVEVDGWNKTMLFSQTNATGIERLFVPKGQQKRCPITLLDLL